MNEDEIKKLLLEAETLKKQRDGIMLTANTALADVNYRLADIYQQLYEAEAVKKPEVKNGQP